MTITRRRERERRERRASILDSAERVFLSKGFDQTTMDDIASAAELSKGTLYLYFKSKDDLFTALSSRLISDMVNTLEEMAQSAVTGVEGIQAILNHYAESVMAQPQHFRIMAGQLVSGQFLDSETPSFAVHRRLVERISEAFGTAIERGKADGTVRRDLDPHKTATLLWGGLLGTTLLRINGEEVMRRFPKNSNFDAFIEGYIQLICDGVRPRDTDRQLQASENHP